MKDKVKKFWKDHMPEIATISTCVAVLGFSHYAHSKRVKGLDPVTCDIMQNDENWSRVWVKLQNGETLTFSRKNTEE